MMKHEPHGGSVEPMRAHRVLTIQWAWVVVTLVLVCFFSDRVKGEEQRVDDTVKTPGETKAGLITMNFKDVDFDVFIKFISELTGKNFIVDPGLKGRVTVLSPEKITIDEAYKTFLSVLEVHGFTTIPAGKAVKIIRAERARFKGVETRLPGKGLNPDDEIITQLIRLKHADAYQIGRLLSPLVFKRTGIIIPYTETNTLILTDIGTNIHRLTRIIKELDVPGTDELISLFPLENASAEKLAPKLRDLFQKKRIRKGETPEVIKVIADERTNSLIVLAPPANTVEIEDLIHKLDREEVQSRERIHIYALQNAVAEDVAGVLGEIKEKSAESKPSEQNKQQEVPPLFSGDVHITADKASNNLVIKAEPEEYAILEKIIKKLDAPRTMVYIETLIMEVRASKSLGLGVEWRFGDDYHGGFEEGEKGGVVLGGSPGASLVDALAAGSLPGGFAAGVVGRAIRLGDVIFPSYGAFIQAVRTDSDFNIISTPQILTLDNEEATFEVGQNIPFVTEAIQPTETDQSTIQSFDYRDIGITLKVTPQINDEGYVRLNVEESVKTVVQTTALGGTVLAPTTTFRTAKTAISVKNGETAVIGGLIEKRMERGKTQTPCLGNIPFLGWAFKSVDDLDDKTNLLVFLTPHIIEKQEDREKLFKKKKEEIDKTVEEAIDNNQPEPLRRKAFQ